MGGQERLRKILRIQCHDEIGSASFGATAERIVSRIGRDAWQSRGGNKFRLLSQQIDYLPDEWTPDAQPFQDSFVFQENLTAHQPDKLIPFDPVPEQIGAWIPGSDLRWLESRDSRYQDRRIDYASRPFSFSNGQRR
jgi:hypothetical protein